MIQKYAVLVKLLHKIRFFDKKLQLTAPETVNKMDHFLWIKKGAARKNCAQYKKAHIFYF